MANFPSAVLQRLSGRLERPDGFQGRFLDEFFMLQECLGSPLAFGAGWGTEWRPGSSLDRKIGSKTWVEKLDRKIGSKKWIIDNRKIGSSNVVQIMIQFFMIQFMIQFFFE